ncbi:transposase [Slackia heliotrinireducens DSM 20476]|uniref:Transposase n=1 Tax=Slackia heliotrinireducens (strain ATCC 29202 / DSM 20476 / NCTC 11029 / RHS 1) TaxID=471855 RepID=C7N284_SLAHD|nr:transposase [Slackia heliotrinireducens DSM 20476]
MRRIMREEGLTPVWAGGKRAPWSSYAGEPTPAPPNLAARNFRSALPNFLWVTDITEFRIPAGKCYLSAVRDCFDSSILAWRVGPHPTADLANASLADACALLAPGEAPVVHSDRGGHYRWPGWIAICEEFGLVRSMSAKGCSPDNAAMEGFFGLLKREFFHGRDWRGWSLVEFMDALDWWIVGYNEERQCSTLGHMTPAEFRRTLGRAA